MLNMFARLLGITVFFFTVTASLHAGKVAAYFDAGYMSDTEVASKLKKEGFTVLSTYTPAKLEHIKVITYTNDALKNMSSKKQRGFAAVQRVMVDSKAQKIRMTNPTFWLQAFLQDDYKSGSEAKIIASLKKMFGDIKESKEALDSGDLAEYHFMMAMPYYKDMLELAEGKNVREKKRLFEVKLDNGSTLVGVKMSKAAEGFVEKIGTENAILLPYTILIEDGKAYALHAKYYLAISYPLLTMGEFMTISSTPDTIKRSLKKALK